MEKSWDTCRIYQYNKKEHTIDACNSIDVSQKCYAEIKMSDTK
jgi:hypothetical protein